MADDRVREGDYRFARIAVSVGLTIAVIFVLLRDGNLDPVTLGFLLTTILLLLGIEGFNLMRSKP